MSNAASTVDPVRLYLQEIGRIPLLSGSDEREVAEKVVLYFNIKRCLAEGREKGIPEREIWGAIARTLEVSIEEAQKQYDAGFKARQVMISANLRLVVSIAKKYQNRNLDLLELIQEGTIGLERAVEKFDPSRNYKFSTYAYWWIRQAISRAISEKARIIRLPIHITEKLNKYKKIQRELAQQLGRTPTRVEIARGMEMTPEQLSDLLKRTQNPGSLDLRVGDEKNDTMMDILPEESWSELDYAEETELKSTIEAVLANLTPQQQEVLRLRFGIGHDRTYSLAEIGEKLGLSREGVRQIERKALTGLRNNRTCLSMWRGMRS